MLGARHSAAYDDGRSGPGGPGAASAQPQAPTPGAGAPLRAPATTAAPPATGIPAGAVTPAATVPGQRAASPDVTATGRQAARGLTAPAVTAAPLATGQAASLVAHQLDNQGPPSDEDSAAGEAHTGPSGRLSRLHVGWHTVSRSSLRRMAVAPATAGLIVGRDQQQNPVTVRAFAPEPVRIALVGGVWAAQLLVFRALALGARVAVVTTDPTAWLGFGEHATGQYNRVAVLTGDQPVAVPGTAQQPILLVYDMGLTGPPVPPPLGPWRSQLTILRQLDRPGIAALHDAQLTLVQRLGGDEAELAVSALRLHRDNAQFLQFMGDDMVAMFGEDTERYLWLAQTPTEQQYGGTPRR